MASVGQRAHKDGTLTSAVLRREQDTGKQTSPTVDDQREAVMFEDFFDVNGKSFRLAPGLPLSSVPEPRMAPMSSRDTSRR